VVRGITLKAKSWMYWVCKGIIQFITKISIQTIWIFRNNNIYKRREKWRLSVSWIFTSSGSFSTYIASIVILMIYNMIINRGLNLINNRFIVLIYFHIYVKKTAD